MGLDEKIINFWKAEGRVHFRATSVVWTSGLQRVQNRTIAEFFPSCTLSKDSPKEAWTLQNG